MLEGFDKPCAVAVLVRADTAVGAVRQAEIKLTEFFASVSGLSAELCYIRETDEEFVFDFKRSVVHSGHIDYENVRLVVDSWDKFRGGAKSCRYGEGAVFHME